VALTVFKFGDFTLDCDRFELYRAGRALKLERKPMELLVFLAAKNGNLVTRTEIAERLWGSEVFVDTEHGINTAIRKIREVLNDDPVQSRFVQTVTGKGYRFIGPIEVPIEALAPTTEEQAGASVENRSRRVWLAASALLVLLIIAVSLGARSLRERSLHRVATPRITSLAVLPLDNLSGDPAQDYFADGMTDELTTMLAKNSTLRIVSRTSVMEYKGVHRPLPEIARELGVDGVLEGSIARSGDKVHMTIQLIQAPTDTHLWAESYERNANDMVSLPTEAAQTIAKRLDSVVLQPAASRYVSPKAHDAYLRGRYLWFTASDFEKSGPYFKKATELQPDYALGWSGLAMYYAATAIQGDIRPEDAFAPGEAAAMKAVELDDSLPDAHLSLAEMILIRHWDWARADQELSRAIELDPRCAEAYHLRAKLYSALNRDEDSIEAEKKSQELEPFADPSAMTLIYYRARQYDDAIREGLLQLETKPDDQDIHEELWEAYRRKGEGKEAEEHLEKMLLLSGDKASAEAIKHQFERGGYKAVALWQLSYYKALSSRQYVSPVWLATLNAELGNREETLTLLEEGYRQHAPLLLWIQGDPAFDFLHSEERYLSIIKRIGLPRPTEAVVENVSIRSKAPASARG
jgi:TolB-like protein/DNA-binding winged helix-turn-helix (wHTH) protein